LAPSRAIGAQYCRDVTDRGEEVIGD
jgi:hypothetical protein